MGAIALSCSRFSATPHQGGKGCVIKRGMVAVARGFAAILQGGGKGCVIKRVWWQWSEVSLTHSREVARGVIGGVTTAGV